MTSTNRYKAIWDARVGTQLNELAIIEYVGEGKVRCLCSCGEECIKRYKDMEGGNTKSCGHLKIAKRTPNQVGKKFFKLTAIEELGIENGQRMYMFECECGSKVKRLFKDVKRGKPKSCGCALLTGAADANRTHGMTGTRIYDIYRAMYDRCHNIENVSFHRYGGRGIKISDEWLGNGGFERFHQWSLENEYSDILTIDRIDNNQGYSPDNCRWTDWITQQNNKSDNLVFKYNDKTQTLAEWARELNLTYDSLWKRIYKYGYSFEKAITYKTTRIRNGNHYGEAI